jgi:hypothetical protein
MLVVFQGLACSRLIAQTTGTTNAPAADAQAARDNRLISFLSPAEQQRYATARAKALAAHPALKAEGEELIRQSASLFPDGTAGEKQAFMEKMITHRQKLRQAMLKEDSGLAPIFAEIDMYISEMKAKHAASAQNSGSSSTNASPTAPTAAH